MHSARNRRLFQLFLTAAAGREVREFIGCCGVADETTRSRGKMSGLTWQVTTPPRRQLTAAESEELRATARPVPTVGSCCRVPELPVMRADRRRPFHAPGPVMRAMHPRLLGGDIALHSPGEVRLAVIQRNPSCVHRPTVPDAAALLGVARSEREIDVPSCSPGRAATLWAPPSPVHGHSTSVPVEITTAEGA